MAMASAPVFSIDGPLMTPPPPGTIRSGHYFRGFRTLVHDLGGDSRKIFELHGVDPMTADDPDSPLRCSTGAAILDYCSKRFNDNLFGLHLADYQDADVYGCMAPLARSAPTLRAALECLAEYLPVLHSPGADIESVTASQTAEFRWRPYDDFGTDEQSISHGLLLIVKLIETLGGRDFRPRYVHAVADIPRKDLAFMEERFRCKVYARSDATAVGFDAGYLDRPLISSDRTVFGLLKSYMAQVKGAAQPTLVDRVVTYVRNELSSESLTLEHCALRLGTTARTLHRHLAQESMTFSEVVEAQRLKAAKRALVDTDESLDDIAGALGYAEQSSFARAFKRWTTMTPQVFRESVRRVS
jgi:AraC-like DNA-binding protein